VRGHIHKHKECIDKTSSVERVEEAERQKEKRVFV
jgi:ubiquitin